MVKYWLRPKVATLRKLPPSPRGRHSWLKRRYRIPWVTKLSSIGDFCRKWLHCAKAHRCSDTGKNPLIASVNAVVKRSCRVGNNAAFAFFWRVVPSTWCRRGTFVVHLRGGVRPSEAYANTGSLEGALVSSGIKTTHWLTGRFLMPR